MRLPMYAGVHSTAAFASSSFGRISSTAMNQSSETRKMSGVWQRQQNGYECSYVSGADEQAAVAEVADDLVGRLDRRDPVQPAVLLVEVARLVHGREHGEVVLARELEVLGAAARRDVDDAGARREVDVVPRDHAVLDLGGRGERVERARGSGARRAPRP